MYSGLNMGSSAYFFAKCLSCTLVFGKRLSLTLLGEQAGKKIEEAREHLRERVGNSGQVGGGDPS